MELGYCTACQSPYSASDVAGLGILRARPAAQGGPLVEYRCGTCGRVNVLVPHGEGRYAPPGVPPPSTVPAEARRPSWVGSDGQPRRRTPSGDAAGAGAAGPAPRAPARAPAAAGGPGPATEPSAPPPARPAQSPRPAEPASDAPLGLAEALEVLGVPPTVSPEELERAYRVRSLGCHPDKVAHLDPEFQALAERKFKRLRAAYELLGGG